MQETHAVMEALAKAAEEGRAPGFEPERITESQFQAIVIGLAQRLGWLVYHTYDSRKSNPGFPDLTMVRGGRLIFAELKVGKNKPEPEQEAWLAALEEVEQAMPAPRCCVAVYLWRPENMGHIEKVLAEDVRRPT